MKFILKNLGNGTYEIVQGGKVDVGTGFGSVGCVYLAPGSTYTADQIDTFCEGGIFELEDGSAYRPAWLGG